MLTQEQAIELHQKGWSKEVIYRLGYTLPPGWNIEQIFSWGILCFNKDFNFSSPYRLYYNSDEIVGSIICASSKIYADGSGTIASKSAGIGVVIVPEFRDKIMISKNIGLGTNNTAELSAIWRGIQEIVNTNAKLEIFSDSQYAIGSLTQEHWVPKANVELIQSIKEDLSVRKQHGGNITFTHVDGHAGNPGNELADRLAGWARKYGDKF